MYSPGYVDEYVAQIDLSGSTERVAYVLQDANFNVAALADDAGVLMARYVWDPYGQLLYANLYGGQQFRIRIGHQGLFFDRLDALATADQLVVGGWGLYQNRNRTYNPVLGRFMQRDPNGSGVPVLAMMAKHGRVVTPGAPGLDAEAMYGDGMSLHAYVCSNPIKRNDPTGLFGLVNIMSTSMSMVDVASHGLEHAAVGVSLQMALASMIVGYAYDLEDDIAWALDWSLPDDDRSRFGRKQAGQPDEATGPAMAALRSLPRRTNGAPQVRLDRTFKKDLRNQARRVLTQRGVDMKGMEVHHRVPLEWSHLMPGDPNRITNIAAVPRNIHQAQIRGMRDDFRNLWQGRTPTPADIQRQVQRVDDAFGWAMKFAR